MMNTPFDEACNLCNRSFAEHGNDPNAPCPTISKELDVVDSDTAILEASERGLHAELIDPHGPGGDNPIIRITGPANIVREVMDLWGFDGYEDT